MLYVWSAFNIILSLFILVVIAHFCYNISFLNKIFDKLPHNFPLILVAVLCFFVLLCSLVIPNVILTEQRRTFPVDAVVTNSEVKHETIYYGEDEFGHSDERTITNYKITYQFEYEGEQYQVTRTLSKNQAVGSTVNIKIDPDNPGEIDNNSIQSILSLEIPAIIVSIGGCMIALKIFTLIFKDFFDWLSWIFNCIIKAITKLFKKD